ncbi:hypothetical protein B1F69_15045 [Pseudomonas syringae]|nr:hypothetical protein PSYAR_17315 [Pseudomonas syringae pv. aceris str. M302273]RXT90884.1 hypothetical protein B1F69_15045 [Pseudomonas syringae]
MFAGLISIGVVRSWPIAGGEKRALKRDQNSGITFKKGYIFARINAAVPNVLSVLQSAHGRDPDMDNEPRIEKWNTQWMITAGRAVCSVCLENQALDDCERPFSHARKCEASRDKFKHPWVALHEILDCARGQAATHVLIGLPARDVVWLRMQAAIPGRQLSAQSV